VPDRGILGIKRDAISDLLLSPPGHLSAPSTEVTMTKLTFDYGTPENNAAVRIARAKLPSVIGKHIIDDKKGRAQYREGYAAAYAFNLRSYFALNGALFIHSDVQLPVLAEMMNYIRTHTPQRDPEDGMFEFFGERFKFFGGGLVDANQDKDSDVIGDMIEWNISRGYVPPPEIG